MDLLNSSISNKFWLKQLVETPERISLTSSSKRSEGIGFNKTYQCDIDNVILVLIENSNKSEIISYIYYVCAYHLLLKKITGGNDFLIVSPQIKLKDDITLNNNPIFLRFKLEDQKSCRENLDICKKTIQECFQNQEYDYGEMIDTLNANNKFHSDLIYQIGFVYKLLQKSSDDIYKCSLVIEIDKGKLIINYKNFIDDDFVSSLADQFQGILLLLLSEPDKTIFDIKLKSEPYEDLLFDDFGDRR